MSMFPVRTAIIVLMMVAAVVGCASRPVDLVGDEPLERYMGALAPPENPDVNVPANAGAFATSSPNVVAEGPNADYLEMSLAEAIQTALRLSKVAVDLGATLIQAPSSLTTIYDPAIQETDPQFGVDAALSEFDALFSASALAEKNDRRFNNRVFGEGGLLDQERAVFGGEITKKAVTGSQFTIRHDIEYDDNNAVTNQFGSSWDAILEAEFRHPLLRGSGVRLNRIAGPNGRPGDVNGVLIARVKTDISLADFQAGMRDFVSNVENAYWDLYFAYRDLEGKILARDAAQKTWNYVYALYDAGRVDAAQEAQAREQYFRLQQEVEDALKGRPVETTRTNNGSPGGTFRAVPGVRTAERRLRLLIGFPASDSRLIRPSTEPNMAEVIFDWDIIIGETLAKRAELRRQRWLIKARELEILANSNYLRPQLDAVGLYRWRGFGDSLLPHGGDVLEQVGNPPRTRVSPYDNAYDSLVSGDLQEWQVGLEFSVPLGHRRAATAVRNSQLKLARARAILDELERRLVYDLSNAVAETSRSYKNYQISYNRLVASSQELVALEAAEEADRTQLDVVLDAQRRFADSVSRYYESQVEYAIALKNVHFEKGTLLEYRSVHLAEGPWPQKAYFDAAERERWRGRVKQNFVMANPPLTSPTVFPPMTGPIAQPPLLPAEPIEHVEEIPLPAGADDSGGRSPTGNFRPLPVTGTRAVPMALPLKLAPPLEISSSDAAPFKQGLGSLGQPSPTHSQAALGPPPALNDASHPVIEESAAISADAPDARPSKRSPFLNFEDFPEVIDGDRTATSRKRRSNNILEERPPSILRFRDDDLGSMLVLKFDEDHFSTISTAAAPAAGSIMNATYDDLFEFDLNEDDSLTPRNMEPDRGPHDPTSADPSRLPPDMLRFTEPADHQDRTNPGEPQSRSEANANSSTLEVRQAADQSILPIVSSRRNASQNSLSLESPQTQASGLKAPHTDSGANRFSKFYRTAPVLDDAKDERPVDQNNGDRLSSPTNHQQP